MTAEGEHIPFRMDPIELQHADHISLVLPLTLEHEIDERSPPLRSHLRLPFGSRLACMLARYALATHPQLLI